MLSPRPIDVLGHHNPGFTLHGLFLTFGILRRFRLGELGAPAYFVSVAM
jgi:hypothetical protein